MIGNNEHYRGGVVCARCIRQSFDFSVIKKTTAIKNDPIDLFGEQTFRNRLADLFRRGPIGGGFILAEQRFLRG